jgi:hypothetical protein
MYAVTQLTYQERTSTTMTMIHSRFWAVAFTLMMTFAVVVVDSFTTIVHQPPASLPLISTTIPSLQQQQVPCRRRNTVLCMSDEISQESPEGKTIFETTEQYGN